VFANLFRFLTAMDRRAVRAVVISLLLILAVALVFVIGRTSAFFDDDDAPLLDWLKENVQSPWALPLLTVIYCLAAFLGAPQMVLHAATIVIFGPVVGFLYGWVATMVSATVTYAMGRFAGQDVLRRYGGASINRLSEFVGRNGIMASFVSRFLPLGPFIIVNMVAGASHMRYWMYALGTGLGQAIKIFFVALTGQSVMALFLDGNVVVALTFGLAAAGWLGAMLFARRILRQKIDQKGE
jgi:uncharacterized membrane protein YdjX (TVP38/TMEM64 family)